MSHNLFFSFFFFVVFYEIKLENVRFVALSDKDVSPSFCLFLEVKGCGTGRASASLTPALGQLRRGEQEFKASLGHGN